MGFSLFFPDVLQGKIIIAHLQHMLRLSGETASFCYYSKLDFLLWKIDLELLLFPVCSGQGVSSQTINGLLFFFLLWKTNKQTNKQRTVTGNAVHITSPIARGNIQISL